jgi:rare lipoprotein A
MKSVIRHGTRWLVFSSAAFVMNLAACAVTQGPAPPTNVVNTTEGVASYYGQKFHGRITSSGETYNMYRMTAASRDIPLGTMVKVTRLDNNRAVTVKVNDRGPFVEGRILDLSYEAARRLDMLEVGLATVRIETLGTGEAPPAAATASTAPPPPTVFWVSLGGFSSKENAVWMRDNLVGNFPDVTILILQQNDQQLRLVTLGPYKSMAEANAAVDSLGRLGLRGTIREDVAR